MRNLKKVLIMVIALTVMSLGLAVNVMADETTQLSSMTIYAVDANGSKTTVPMAFDSEVYEYDITIMSDAVEIDIEAEVADSSSTWVVEKDGINTKMDEGTNFTAVTVTSATGETATYKINTTKLTAEEEATYEGEAGKNAEGSKTVKVGKKEYTIATSIPEGAIPEGFEEDVATYEETEYPCIKGDRKELTAFYLFNEETNGFFIYDGAGFYEMNNIMIKSRMYTVVQPAEVDGFLDAYQKEKVTIIDQEVKAWVLDAEEGMYLVYAMNWDGETSLYCYDDKEKCFQRYLTSANSQSQMEAANSAYENLLKKYNKLVDKYNLLIKVICGLAVLIVVLIFVIINLAITKKTKKLVKQQREEKRQGVEEESQILFAGKTEDDVEDVEDATEEKDEEEIQLAEIEENLKETLKSMLPSEDEEEETEDDVDFEFIDLD